MPDMNENAETQQEYLGRCHDCTAPQTEVNMLSRHILELQADKGRLTDELTEKDKQKLWRLEIKGVAEMTTRVYLSGQITGLTKEEYTRNFARAEQHYTTAGYEVVNPVKIGEALHQENPDAGYEDYMARDLEALRSCTAIALIAGWENSPGAAREKAEAERLGLEIMQLKFVK